jgi:histidine kinase
MSIKVKLIFSYIAMIFIPVALIILSGYLTNNFILPKNRDFRGEFSFGISFHSKKSEQLSTKITKMIKTQPERFINPDYLRKFETVYKLSGNDMGIISILEKKTVFISPKLPGQALIKQIGQKKDESNVLLIFDNKAFSLQRFDFVIQKSKKCTLHLVTDATSFYHFGKTIIILIPLALALFIILTNGLLTYFMSRNIIRPLRELQNATEQIKAGNLDFQIAIHSKDELGKLAEAFEEMRSRLKESLETQMQYETNRKELIAGISHDLKTPVTSVKGYVEGILDGVAVSQDKLQHYLKTIQSKTNSLDKLIDELFLFSKLDLGKLPFQFERVQLQELVRDFYQELQLELSENDTVLRFEVDFRQPVWVMADREKLARVIRNLVDNSLKYMPNQAEHRIVLGIKDGPEEATVWVGDNGRGISSADLPFIFDSFFRADRARNTDTDGNGLGLAIAKRIITEHKGRIWAESNLGHGTTISFSLPKLLPEQSSL